MDRETVIRLAQEAWKLEFIPEHDLPKLERFARLVDEAERDRELRVPSTAQSEVEELEKELMAHKLLVQSLVEERNHYRKLCEEHKEQSDQIDRRLYRQMMLDQQVINILTRQRDALQETRGQRETSTGTHSV